jgi:predicted TIM-barrel fold metal-dependent hydrolase
MIIDSHAHLGSCRVFDATITADELMRTMDENGVDASIVLPLPGAPDCPAAHDAIAALASKHPGRIYGVACLNPHCDDDAYFAEVQRCVRELGFVGLKLHPLGHGCSPTGRDAEKVFETARALRIPVIVHTGIGAPFALPSLVIPRAQQYPHAGAYIYSAEALIAAQVCPNIYLETSWCGPHRIRDMANALGPERVMFGADLPANVATELTKYRTGGLSPEAQEICLAKSAMAVFNIPAA